MPRTRSLGVCLLVGVISVAGLVCGLGVAHQRTPRPSYQGKPLEYWFNQLPMTRIDVAGFDARVKLSDRMTCRTLSGAFRAWGSWMETPKDSANAICAIGTDGLAFYLRKLRQSISTREMQIVKVARAAGFHGFLFEDVYPERQQAVTALIVLKPLPPEVVSELVALSTSRDQDIAAAARCALRAEEKDLLFLHSPASKRSLDYQSLDIDLLNLPSLSDFK